MPKGAGVVAAAALGVATPITARDAATTVHSNTPAAALRRRTPMNQRRCDMDPPLSPGATTQRSVVYPDCDRRNLEERASPKGTIAWPRVAGTAGSARSGG